MVSYNFFTVFLTSILLHSVRMNESTNVKKIMERICITIYSHILNIHSHICLGNNSFKFPQKFIQKIYVPELSIAAGMVLS